MPDSLSVRLFFSFFLLNSVMMMLCLGGRMVSSTKKEQTTSSKFNSLLTVAAAFSSSFLLLLVFCCSSSCSGGSFAHTRMLRLWGRLASAKGNHNQLGQCVSRLVRPLANTGQTQWKGRRCGPLPILSLLFLPYHTTRARSGSRAFVVAGLRRV